MTAPHYDFDADATIEREPAGSFTLGGREWRIRPIEEVPAKAADLIIPGAAVQIREFFALVLEPEDRADFMAMVEDPDSALTVGNLESVIRFVSEKVLRRPTGRPVASRRGPALNGATSRVASSLPASEHPAD